MHYSKHTSLSSPHKIHPLIINPLCTPHGCTWPNGQQSTTTCEIDRLHRLYTLTNHEHTNNNSETNNEPMGHHLKIRHPRHINKHTRLTSWHFCQLTNHVIKTMVVMTLDPQVNPNININIREPQTNHQRIFNFEVATWFTQHDANFNTHLN